MVCPLDKTIWSEKVYIAKFNLTTKEKSFETLDAPKEGMSLLEIAGNIVKEELTVESVGLSELGGFNKMIDGVEKHMFVFQYNDDAYIISDENIETDKELMESFGEII